MFYHVAEKNIYSSATAWILCMLYLVTVWSEESILCSRGFFFKKKKSDSVVRKERNPKYYGILNSSIIRGFPFDQSLKMIKQALTSSQAPIK